MFKNVKEAMAYVGGLSEPSKMPCFSYSLPVSHCGIGKIMHKVPGSVCSKCYAWNRGNYRFGSVKNALERRFQTLKKPYWSEAFIFILNSLNQKYMRLHDSGEIQGVWHLRNIVKVAKGCPDCQFWLPTRETKIVNDYMEQYGEIPPNLTIRLSASMIDGPAPHGLATKWGFCTARVVTDKKEANCHAQKTDGKCGDCRKCWNKEVFEVSYHVH